MDVEDRLAEICERRTAAGRESLEPHEAIADDVSLVLFLFACGGSSGLQDNASDVQKAQFLSSGQAIDMPAFADWLAAALAHPDGAPDGPLAAVYGEIEQSVYDALETFLAQNSPRTL